MARVRTRARRQRAKQGKQGKRGKQGKQGKLGKASEGSKGSKGKIFLKIYLTRSKQGTLTVIEAREKPSA